MSSERESQVVSATVPSERDVRGAVDGQPAQAVALHRLQASRARIRGAMDAHIRESASQQVSPRDAPRSLSQRLLDRVGRLPIIRTALAIRDFRRG